MIRSKKTIVGVALLVLGVAGGTAGALAAGAEQASGPTQNQPSRADIRDAFGTFRGEATAADRVPARAEALIERAASNNGVTVWDVRALSAPRYGMQLFAASGDRSGAPIVCVLTVFSAGDSLSSDCGDAASVMHDGLVGSSTGAGAQALAYQLVPDGHPSSLRSHGAQASRTGNLAAADVSPGDSIGYDSADGAAETATVPDSATP